MSTITTILSTDLVSDSRAVINTNFDNLNTDKLESSVYTASDVKSKYESNANTNAFTDAEQTKLGYITVTQAVDLDQMETDIAALAGGMVYKGDWDASAGTFPGGGSAKTGWFYYVSVGGTVDSVTFNVGDNIVATTDNASTTTYTGNWSKHDQTDAVQSVNGQTGSVTLTQDNISDGATYKQYNPASVAITGGTISGITDLAIADGGTGASTAQTAINALTQVSGATNEYVLTKDTATGDAIWKQATGSGGGKWNPGTITIASGDISLGIILDIPVPEGLSITSAYLSSATSPDGADITVQIYKVTASGAPVSTDSIFTSDVGISITDAQAENSNGLYQTEKTAIDNGTYTKGQRLVVEVTSIGSTVAGSSVYLSIITA